MNNKHLVIFLFSLLVPVRVLAELPAEVDQECRRIGAKLGSVSYRDCANLHMMATNGNSVNNATILLKEYPPLPDRIPMGRVLLIGGIHGDEYSSVSIIFKWMKILEQYHSGLFHWHISPLVNPDGLLRKQSTRVNANGVDLNRNFPMPNWIEETRHYWEVKTLRNPRRFPGKSPISEPETQWLVDEIKWFQPDVIVSVHAPHGIVDYDGPQEAPYKLGRLYLNLLGTYPGSLGRYAGVELKLPVVTIELPYAGIMPKPDEISHIWTDLISWLKKNLKADLLQTAQETDPS